MLENNYEQFGNRFGLRKIYSKLEIRRVRNSLSHYHFVSINI